MIKSLDELEKIRQNAKKEIKEREGGFKIRLVVGMGTCGIAVGARETLAALVDEIAKKNLENASVSQIGCLGNCKQEPVVVVQKPGMGEVAYGNIDAQKARRIVADHVVNNSIVKEWVIKFPSE